MRVYFLIFIFFNLYTVNSQVKEIGLPKIKNFTKTEYKSGTQNWNIDQDSNGNIYFANNNGLLQFDGLSWQVYTIPNSESVRSVKVDDSTGRVFVGGYNEFGYFEPDEKGKLIYKSLFDSVKSPNNSLTDFIWKIHIYKNEVVFQSFLKTYLFKNNQIELIEPVSRFQFSFIVGENLYFQDIAAGVLQYKDGKLYSLKGTTVFNDAEIWGMFSLSKSKLLIATLEKGLFVYENEQVKPWKTEANNFIEKNGSLGGASLKNNLIVFNTVLNGVIVCDLKGKIIQHIDLKRGLQNNTVLCSFIDSKNDLWLGLDNGISFVNENSPFTFFDSSYNLSTVYASVVHEGLLYAATNQGVFYHELDGPFLDDNFNLVEGTTSQSWNIQIIGEELICSNNSGALLIKGKKVIKILDNQGYYALKKVPSRSNFYIGANYAGFGLFEKTAGGLEFRCLIEGLGKSSNFFEIDDNFVWMRRDGIIYQMKLSDDLKSFISVNTISKIETSTNGVNSIQTINGKVYFENENHFYTYSVNQDVFIEDKKFSKLFENLPRVNSLIEDSNGNLWYTFNESLGVFMKDKKGNYKNSQSIFSNLAGYLVNNYVSINTVNPKNIFIGSTNGLVHFDSEFLNMKISKPQIFIRNFVFANDTVIQGHSKLKENVYSMPYSSNNVKFTFSTPEFENSDKVTFSYQLKPFDSIWSPWADISMKEYTNLREGSYNMKVKVKNSFGVESDVRTLNFTISPPWYRSYLAYLTYLVMVGLAIYIVSIIVKSRYRKREYYKTIEQRKLYLEKESKIRAEQYILEKEIEKLKRNKLKTKLLSKNKELVNNSLQVVKKNESLNNIIQKLKKMEVDSLNDETKNQLGQLKKSIIKEIKDDHSWKDLEKHIKNVHFDFLKRLKEKHPTISPRELDLSTYLLINMSTKEIAEIMNISSKGVELARYRLRKKMGLKRRDSLTGFLMNI